MSVKISQLGSEFDLDLAYENMREILLKADECGKMRALILRNIIVYNRCIVNLKENLKCRYEFKHTYMRLKI